MVDFKAFFMVYFKAFICVSVFLAMHAVERLNGDTCLWSLAPAIWGPCVY